MCTDRNADLCDSAHAGFAAYEAPPVQCGDHLRTAGEAEADVISGPGRKEGCLCLPKDFWRHADTVVCDLQEQNVATKNRPVHDRCPDNSRPVGGFDRRERVLHELAQHQLHQDEIARRGWAANANEALALAGRPDVALIDLRERSERERQGIIPGALYVPYPRLQEHTAPGGVLHELVRSTGKRLVLYCAFGERSAMTVQASQDEGLTSACHIEGGIDAWKRVNGPTVR